MENYRNIIKAPIITEKTADLAGGACYIEHGENSLPSY